MVTAARSRLEVLVTGEDDLSPIMKKVESSIIRSVGAISAALAGIKIGAAPIIAAAAFEREMANVAKTVADTTKPLSEQRREINALGKELLQMSLYVDVAATDLAKIAASAGQQGLGRFGTEGVRLFTESISRMSSVLDIAADEAADNAGKLINIFQIPAQEVEKISSTINEVSNQSTASGEDLLDVVKRIGNAAGALDLKGASALAAAALDFGASPEVAGSTFSRFFEAATQKADEFAEIMGGSAEGWIKTLQEDGVGAFRSFLAKLRTLTAQDQQKALIKLVGGGRQGAVINKFIQDTTDSVLLRDLAAAEKGQLGLSAIDEQATVLKTLDAQVKILGNSFVKLGIDSAESLLGPLAEYAAQLSRTLQDPGVKSFVNAAVQSIGSLIKALVDATKFVASLNINWENFLRVSAAFTALKLGEAVLGIVAKLSVFGVSLRSLVTDSLAAGRALNGVEEAVKKTSAASGTFKPSRLASAFGLEDLSIKFQARKKALEELKKAELELAAAQSASAATQPKANIAQAAASSAASTVSTAVGAVAAQNAKLIQAEQAAAAALVAQQSALAARRQTQESASAAARLQIETDYQTRRRAIVATGTETGLKALRAEKALRLEAEAAANTRSLAGIDAYYARRAAIENAAHAAAIVAERNALAARQALQTQFQAESNVRAAAAASTGAAATAAGAGLAAATSRLTATQAAAQAAGVAFVSLGTFINGFLSVLGKVARVGAGAFLWATIVFSVLDAFRLFEGDGIIARLADGIKGLFGLETEGAKKQKIEAQERLSALEKERQAVEGLTAAYRKNIDERTGRLKESEVKAQVTLAGLADPNKQQAATIELANISAGAQATATGDRVDRSKELRDAIAKIEQELDEGRIRIDAKRKQIEKVLQFAAPQSKEGITAKLTKEITDLETAAEAAKKQAAEFADRLSDVSLVSERAGGDLDVVSVAAAGLFTPQSIEKAREYVKPILELVERSKQLQSVLKELQQRVVSGDQSAVVPLAAVRTALEQTGVATTEANKKFQEFIKSQTGIKQLPPEVLNSFFYLSNLLGLTNEQFEALIKNQEKLSKVAPELQDGKKAPPRTPAAAGDGNFASKKEESQASKLARLRLQRAKAELEAQKQLQAEFDTAELAALEDKFHKGLISISKYYEDKKKLQQESLTSEIELLDQEVTIIDDAIKRAGDPVEKARFEIEKMRAFARQNVLVIKRDITAAEELNRGKTDQTREFSDEIRAETLRLQEAFVLPATANELFQSSLQVLLDGAREKIAKFRAEGQSGLADALIASLRADSFKRSIALIEKDIGTALAAVGRGAQNVELLQQAGDLTANGGIREYNDFLKSQLPFLEEKVKLLEDIARAIEAERGAADKLAREARSHAEQARLNLRQTALETEKAAKKINDSLTASIADGLDKLTSYGSSLKDEINGVLLSVATSIKRLFLDDLAQRIAKEFGFAGGKGFGGAVQATLELKPGETGPMEAAIKNFFSSAETGFNELGSTLQKVFKKAGDSLVDYFPDIASFLGITKSPVTPVIEVVQADTPNQSDAETARLARQDFKSSSAQSFPIGPTGRATDPLHVIIQKGPTVPGTKPQVPDFSTGGGGLEISDSGDASEEQTFASSSGEASASLDEFSAKTDESSAATTAAFGSIASAAGAISPAFGQVVNIAQLLIGVFNSVAAAAAAAAAADRAKAVSSVVAHTGGIIGTTPLTRRSVDPGIFRNAPRYHGGGTAGLRAGEVPAILEKGEQVLTKNQQSIVAAAMSSGERQGEMNIRNVLVTDPNFVPDAMSTAAGEKVLTTYITRNRASIRQSLGV